MPHSGLGLQGESGHPGGRRRQERDVGRTRVEIIVERGPQRFARGWNHRPLCAVRHEGRHKLSASAPGPHASHACPRCVRSALWSDSRANMGVFCQSREARYGQRFPTTRCWLEGALKGQQNCSGHRARGGVGLPCCRLPVDPRLAS